MIDLVTRSGKYRIVQSAELPHVAVLVPGNLNEEGHSTNGRTGAALLELCTELEELRAAKAALKRCHDLLTDAEAVIDPEQHPDLSKRIYAELAPCDEHEVCPTLAKEPAEPPLPLGHRFQPNFNVPGFCGADGGEFKKTCGQPASAHERKPEPLPHCEMCVLTDQPLCCRCGSGPSVQKCVTMEVAQSDKMLHIRKQLADKTR